MSNTSTPASWWQWCWSIAWQTKQSLSSTSPSDVVTGLLEVTIDAHDLPAAALGLIVARGAAPVSPHQLAGGVELGNGGAVTVVRGVVRGCGGLGGKRSRIIGMSSAVTAATVARRPMGPRSLIRSTTLAALRGWGVVGSCNPRGWMPAFRTRPHGGVPRLWRQLSRRARGPWRHGMWRCRCRPVPGG